MNLEKKHPHELYLSEEYITEVPISIIKKKKMTIRGEVASVSNMIL